MKQIISFLLSFLALARTRADVSCIVDGQNTCNRNTQLSVTIYNSYSGSIAWIPWTHSMMSGWILWTNTTIVDAAISATSASSFQSSWNIHFFSGYEIASWWYTVVYPVQLSSWDGIKTWQLWFLKNALEPYLSNSLEIFLDTTPPIAMSLLWPSNNSLIQSTGFSLDWSASNDTGIGLSHYIVRLSLVPDMSSSISFYGNSNTLSFLSNQLPVWTIYRQIQAYDFLWNTTTSPIWFFHHQAPSLPSSIWFWGWISTYYHTTSEIIKQQDTTPLNQDHDDILILQDNSIYTFNENSYPGDSLLQNTIIKDIMIEKFTTNPVSQDRLLPHLLPKTWVRVEDLMHGVVQSCRYEHSCKHYNYSYRWILFFIVLLLLFFIKKLSQRFDK